MSRRSVTPTKKQRFLQNYVASFGVVKTACEKTGIDRKTFYRWEKEDAEFAATMKEAEAEVCDTVEKMYVEWDLTDPEKSDNRKFWLRTRHPKFMEKLHVENPATVTAAEMIIAALKPPAHVPDKPTKPAKPVVHAD